MIGATPGDRTPFTPPKVFYQPQLPRMRFDTHLRPFGTMRPRFATGWQPRLQNVNNPLPYAPVATAAPPTPGPAMGSMGGAFGRSPVYDVMRQGLIPRVGSNASNVMIGVTSAGKLVKRLTPSGYTNANLPAGGYY